MGRWPGPPVDIHVKVLVIDVMPNGRCFIMVHSSYSLPIDRRRGYLIMQLDEKPWDVPLSSVKSDSNVTVSLPCLNVLRDVIPGR